MTTRHEGVSCDACMKGNFRGRRYKCLICFDYDLCAMCYEAGATTSRHVADHPMQCILTGNDFELYYGGESLTMEQPQAFTCPYCSRMGFTESSLHEHVASEHADQAHEVVCPVCAALPGGDPNLVTDDFLSHLNLEHRATRDLDTTISRPVRRLPHPGRGNSSGGGRSRRSNMQCFPTSSLSPSARESMDPIAELLSQLSGVRRSGASSQQGSSGTPSQLQQLQMQLQAERQQAQAQKQHLERLTMRQAKAATSNAVAGNAAGALTETSGTRSAASSNASSQFLLSRFTEPQLSDIELEEQEKQRADRSLFVQELLLATLAEKLSLGEEEEAKVSDPAPTAAAAGPVAAAAAAPNYSSVSPTGAAAGANAAAATTVATSKSPSPKSTDNNLSSKSTAKSKSKSSRGGGRGGVSSSRSSQSAAAGRAHTPSPPTTGARPSTTLIATTARHSAMDIERAKVTSREVLSQK